MPRRERLSRVQRAALIGIPTDRDGLARHYTLSAQDRVLIAAKRGDRNRLGFAIARAGELAAFPFPIHPHMLRHSAGYKLANDGHDTRAIQQYLRHRNITHTVRYTELSPERFKNFWKD